MLQWGQKCIASTILVEMEFLVVTSRLLCLLVPCPFDAVWRVAPNVCAYRL